MIDVDLFFRFVKGRCYGNQIMLDEVMNTESQTDTTCILCTSVKNELEYH